ncbi:MAG: hypothetical protein U1C96_03430 [Gallionella sp.]|nr:hypothetical protein [Gallionella sp.]
MTAAYKKYCFLLLACCASTLLPILALNLILIEKSLNSPENIKLASRWQQETHGIVSAPSMLDNVRFKQLRLQDRINDIDTVIFGASTTFAVEQDMFPASLHIYNFSKNGVGLNTMIGEAEYLLGHTETVKWLFIPLDWSIGFIYHDALPPTLDLSAQYPGVQRREIGLLEKLRDACSYPRIAGLFQLIKDIVRSEHEFGAFRQIFLQPGSDEYSCPDGMRAKDFDSQNPGVCRGFRSDGSWTFNGMDRVSDAHKLAMLAVSSSSQYTTSLSKAKGIPNPDYLQRLADLAHQAERRGGGAVFFAPPLLPGMELEFLRHPEWSAYLAHTKKTLSAWSTTKNLVFFDAGQSEKFGCTADEFTDEHHATSPCYRKVFSAFWQNANKPDGTPLLQPKKPH